MTERAKLAWLCAGVAPTIAGLTQAGYGFSMTPAIAVVVIVISGLCGGAIAGDDGPSRALNAVGYLLASAGIAGAVYAYASLRSELWRVELVLPMLVGASPGALALWAIRRRQ